MDYYGILGVKKESSAEEIKAAYRRLAKLHHPDLHPEKNKSAEGEKFKAINEAYEALSSPEKRAKYDQLGAAPPETPEPPRRPRDSGDGGNAGAFSGFSDFFENLYGGDGARDARAGGSARGAPGRGQDIEAELPVSLEDAARGGEKKFALNVPALCPSCGGSGRRGRGFCPACGGVGESLQEKTITARLPAAVREGMKLRLRGQGAPAAGGGEPGDLFLRVRFLPHPAFKVSGPDLEAPVTVMPWIAALGGEASVPSLEGPVRIKIPPGTHAGRILRVAGKGLGREDGGRGDLHAVVRIDIPDRSDAKLERLYREMREAGS